jgi:ADP-ribosylglycohydrolase
LDRTVDSIRSSYSFDVSCQGTVPEAIVAFLDSESYEDAVRNAVSLGGDSDTLACIAGGIAEAYYEGVPDGIRAGVEKILTPDLWEVTRTFRDKHACR